MDCIVVLGKIASGLQSSKETEHDEASHLFHVTCSWMLVFLTQIPSSTFLVCNSRMPCHLFDTDVG